MFKGAVKVQNLQGVNTTKKNLKKKHYQIFEKKTLPKCKKHYHHFKNAAIFLKKTLPKCKKHCHIIGKTLPKLKKHYQHYPLSTPCPARTTGGRPPVPPVLVAPLLVGNMPDTCGKNAWYLRQNAW